MVPCRCSRGIGQCIAIEPSERKVIISLGIYSLKALECVVSFEGTFNLFQPVVMILRHSEPELINPNEMKEILILTSSKNTLGCLKTMLCASGESERSKSIN